jgi:hypothetical protein
MNMDRDFKVLKECIEFIQNHKQDFHEGDTPYTEDEEIGFDISENRIFEITEPDHNRKLGFVDGGTASLLNAADFNISLNRIAGVKFEANKFKPLVRTPAVIEFYSATVLESLSDGKMAYITKLFPREKSFNLYLPENDIIIPLDEARMIFGFRFMPNIQLFGATAMRFSEWSYATKFIENELDKGDIFIRDGSLQTGFKDEILLVKDLYFQAKKKQIYITGLSKSCRLVTQNGDALMPLIELIGNSKYPESKWYFHPIYQITKADNMADVYFVKLHEKGRSPFRFDIYLEQSNNLNQNQKEDIISNIALNSNDLAFPGYPYGLIKADLLSRVGVKEIEPQKIQLLSEFDSEIYNKFIVPRIKAVDAHDILNSIRKN